MSSILGTLKNKNKLTENMWRHYRGDLWQWRCCEHLSCADVISKYPKILARPRTLPFFDRRKLEAFGPKLEALGRKLTNFFRWPWKDYFFRILRTTRQCWTSAWWNFAFAFNKKTKIDFVLFLQYKFAGVAGPGMFSSCLRSNLNFYWEKQQQD